jgi:hypothetical protein
MNLLVYARMANFEKLRKQGHLRRSGAFKKKANNGAGYNIGTHANS